MSGQPSESFLKVPYDLRPAKQVERRMLLDFFQRLGHAGFPIRRYQYTGFGSIYFVDFILFHKLLGLTELLSVEYLESWENRVRFNKPYRDVRVEIGDIGDYIPDLDKERGHVLWLDYDHTLDADDIGHVRSAAANLSPGSVLLVTTDVEPPELDDEDHDRGPEMWRQYYESQFDELLDVGLQDSDFGQSRLPALSRSIIWKAVQAGLTGRDLDFVPLLSFDYADGHRMITVGGMLVGERERARLSDCDWTDAKYIRGDWDEDPCTITVPNLTRREKFYLDAHMPCDDAWVPQAFELGADTIRAYRDIYRYFPHYAELLI